ncbi:hypothetical protein AHW27_000291 [Salmonella enterica subsp. enterica]|nr:hypothetical protein [Salmonella enterica subsp. enterica serovar Thompson]EDV9554317.1 hypothetical protein [Salmonella enterica subsp. enterica serovar Thompson]EEC0779615.1 hypothetical protein [Salmonella enterica subsp. enterica serovar Hvittingfoss]
MSLGRMVNLTTRCPAGYRWRKTSHTYRVPFCGLPQPEAHYRSGFNARPYR